MDRKIAERGRFPSINILRSVSRTMPNCNSEFENKIVKKARQLLATYEDMADMIKIGAYRKGSAPTIDEAIKYYNQIEQFLMQDSNEFVNLETGYKELSKILGIN